MVAVSIVIPTMNEETSIGEVLDEIRAAMAGRDYEIVTVDTSSRDRTNIIAAAKGARVVPEPRRGYGRAYRTGFASTEGSYIVTMDADLTYPGDRIPELLQPLEVDRADFVSGDRLSGLSPGAMSGMHRIGNEMLNRAFHLLFRYPIVDSQSGMWAFRRAILSRVRPTNDGMAFSEELKLETIRAGYRFLEVPIEYRSRIGERKIRSFRDAAGNMAWLLRRRFGWLREA